MNFKKDLPLTSSHWGTYRAKVKDGKIKELIGWENKKYLWLIKFLTIPAYDLLKIEIELSKK